MHTDTGPLSYQNNLHSSSNSNSGSGGASHPHFRPRPPPVLLRLGVVALVVVGIVLYSFTTQDVISNTNEYNTGKIRASVSMIDRDTSTTSTTKTSLSFWGSSSSNNKRHAHKTKQHELNHAASSPPFSPSQHNQVDKNIVIPMPHGVNLGSWLSLEDYFYVGDTGAVEVATPDQSTAAVCLPPLHVGQIGAPPWQSETDLFRSMLKTTTTAKALKVFQAHRAK